MPHLIDIWSQLETSMMQVLGGLTGVGAILSLGQQAIIRLVQALIGLRSAFG